jgi:fructose-1,6-bisphosphatase/inositol monophosphatase family enzyme
MQRFDTGVIDAYYQYNLKPWDVAAGALIVEEAGGCGFWGLGVKVGWLTVVLEGGREGGRCTDEEPLMASNKKSRLWKNPGPWQAS